MKGSLRAIGGRPAQVPWEVRRAMQMFLGSQYVNHDGL
jgi:hypothetical protein